MSESAISFIGAAHGPVHAGTGDQSNNFTFVMDETYRQLLLHGRRDRRSVARDYVLWLHQRFVEPSNYGSASDRLAEAGCVVLDGPRGSGKDATARMLLYRLPEPYVPIHDVPLEQDEPDLRLLDGTTIQAGDRLVLDLSGTDDARYRTILPLVASYRAEARERNAHLVIVLGSGQDRSLPSELVSLVVEIGRPDGRTVLHRYLRTDGIPCTREQLDAPELAKHLANEPIRNLAALAKWIRTARERIAGRGTFPEWLASATKALSDKDAEVAAQLESLDGGRQRALLLATAMLSGASSDAVHDATVTLLNAVEHPADERPRLERPSMAEQLAAIEVRTDRSGRLEFDTLDYDRAVRAHFWTNYPNLRDAFREWTQQTVRLPSLSDEYKYAFVLRFTEQALRVDRPDDLTILVRGWTNGSNSELLPQAAKVMEQGLGNDRYGGTFRRQIYYWSTERGLPRDLIDLLIRTCTGVLALTHPEQALVRLHHLARRQAGAALDALLDLVADDARLLVRLLNRLSDAFHGENRWPVDRELFRMLADPVRLTDDTTKVRPLIASASIRVDLTSGWQAMLTGPVELWVGRVRDWLSAGVDNEYQDQLLAVLVDACGQRAELFGRLYLVAQGWAREPVADRAARARTAGVLFDKIDSAQGVDT